MKINQAALILISFAPLLEYSQSASFLATQSPWRTKILSLRDCRGALGSVAFMTTGSFPNGDANDIRLEESDSDEVPPFSPTAEASLGSTRRSVLGTLPLLSLGGGGRPANAGVATTVEASPLADLPMQRLRLPNAAVGREYVLIQLTVQGKGPFEFMVDSGLTTELITPHLQQTLGIVTGKDIVKGLAAGGDTSSALVELDGAALCCGKFADPAIDALPLPTLHAVVTDFPQEHLDPAHDPVEGMLGMEMLNLFDADFDFPKGRLRLWTPGTAAAAAATAGLVEVPSAVLNETLLLGIRVASPNQPRERQQPVVGIIDCGATFSAINWAAAELLGLPPKTDRRAYGSGPAISAVGVDGRPMLLPTRDVPLTFCGNPSKDSSGQVQFEPPAERWRPWDPVKLGIGDLPVFSEALGDGRTPFRGPAALIGLDVLSQRRVILETGKGRNRRLFVSPS